jgi:quercetin dioxygenase-like cupin family protein
MSGILAAQEAKVTELMSKDLTNLPGKEGLMIIVDYPPGSTDPIHRHNAHGFIYVLEGSIVMQVRGGKEVTLTPGQTFYEGPEDVHVVGENLYEHDYRERWHNNLLQRLGQRPGGHVFARMAAVF